MPLNLPEFSNFFTVEHATGPPYTRGSFEVEYVWHEGIQQIPIAEPPSAFSISSPPPCEIVREHAPCGQLVIQWMAKRRGAMPLLPDPRSASAPDNVKLARMHIRSAAPRLNTAGTVRSYRVWGTYIYFLVRAVYVPQVGGWMGWQVWDQIAPGLNVISANDFRQVF